MRFRQTASEGETALNGNSRNIFVWLIIIFMMFSLFNVISNSSSQQASTTVTYSEFLNEVERGDIASVSIDGERLKATRADGQVVRTVMPVDDKFVDRLRDAGVEIDAKPQEQSFSMSLLSIFGPFLLLMALLFFMMNRMQGGGRGGALGFGKSRAKMLNERADRVTFDDVAGIDEAKDELQEIVEFLRDPTKFSRLGGKIPKGALLVGPPGTGKTLLARAIAGEAGVPFFSISGSDFVEMFVGVGASRVRDMFEQAKKNAPCIVFIDEIDAVGRHRGAGYGGGQ